ncbi:MAG: DUF3857 domain-containing protein [Nibricoccus sp.]
MSFRIHPGLAYFSMCLCLLSTFANCLAEPASAPNWVNEAAEQPASFPYGKAPAVMLLDELLIDVSPDGTFTYRTRGVTRILTADGRSEAKASVSYNTEMSRVVSFKAWLVRPKDPVLVYGKNKIVETAAYGTSRELYSAGHRQQISAVADAEAGSVFAWESVREEKQIISQTLWNFTGRFPIECSRLSVRLPKTWQAEPHVFNHANIPAIATENTLTWELRQLPAVRRELFSPASIVTQPAIGLDIKPPATANNICRKSLFSWSAISAYFTPLYHKAATPSAEMKTKADALVVGATTMSERISRLCLYAQKTNYISITLNAEDGGGMIPQPAEKVFRCNYGDCKDKATFLRGLLRTQGIESYPVIVYSGDRQRVRAEWPAVLHFNHCILAIQVDDTIDGPALLIHPKLGRLMIFDPTNPYVPFGILPHADSGGYGLFLSGADGDLCQLPLSQPSSGQKSITLKIQADGSFVGTVKRVIAGPTAEQIRAEFRNTSPTDFQMRQQKQIQQSVAGAEVEVVEAIDAFEQGSFTLTENLKAKAYGKPMRDTLLVFKPIIFPASSALPTMRIKRTQPLRIDAIELTENTEISLPDGFAVDELPTNTDLQSSVGRYSASIQKNASGQLVLNRTLALKETTVPAENYPEIVRFAEKVQEAEQSPVVLKRL